LGRTLGERLLLAGAVGHKRSGLAFREFNSALEGSVFRRWVFADLCHDITCK